MFWISAICALEFKMKGQSQVKLTISPPITPSFLKDTIFCPSNTLTKSTLILKSVGFTCRLCFRPSCLIFPYSSLVPKIPEITKCVSSLRSDSPYTLFCLRPVSTFSCWASQWWCRSSVFLFVLECKKVQFFGALFLLWLGVCMCIISAWAVWRALSDESCTDFPCCVVGSSFLSFRYHIAKILVSSPVFTGFVFKIILTVVLNSLNSHNDWDAI